MSMSNLERKLNDIFSYEEIRLEVRKATMKSCDGCYFEKMMQCRTNSVVEHCGNCSSSLRIDKENVIFKQI
jgi:hypothetical protein